MSCQTFEALALSTMLGVIRLQTSREQLSTFQSLLCFKARVIFNAVSEIMSAPQNRSSSKRRTKYNSNKILIKPLTSP